MGSLITRALIMALGYVYPAYKCFKCVEMNRADVEQLRFWCQYWIIIAVVSVLERLGDTFISWLPLYTEAKLAFIIYLWSPKTLGTSYVYSGFLRPLVATHEGEIDRHLNELTARAGDLITCYWQKGYVYAQSRFMELLQVLASQAPPSGPEQVGVDHSQTLPPRPPPPPVPPGYQPPLEGYHSSPPATDYSPSAPVMPSEYVSQQGGPTSSIGAGQGHPYMQSFQNASGYPPQIAGYPPPAYVAPEQEAPSQEMTAQPLPHAASHRPPELNGYMTRRSRPRRLGDPGHHRV